MKYIKLAEGQKLNNIRIIIIIIIRSGVPARARGSAIGYYLTKIIM